MNRSTNLVRSLIICERNRDDSATNTRRHCGRPQLILSTKQMPVHADGYLWMQRCIGTRQKNSSGETRAVRIRPELLRDKHMASAGIYLPRRLRPNQPQDGTRPALAPGPPPAVNAADGLALWRSS